ncbi:MAG: hypothetical protein ACLFNM_01045 [Candidatus Woesearchaeota archaeon]
MNVLAQLIKELEYDDLLLLKKDVDKGTIKKILNKQIKQKQKEKQKICPVCEGAICKGCGFHLEFGSADFRQEATFDGIDCLNYFIKNTLKK